MFDFGIPWLGFYHLHKPERKNREPVEDLGGVLWIKEGVANVALVKQELKLYDDKWDWRV
jgi:hypothetical protein